MEERNGMAIVGVILLAIGAVMMSCSDKAGAQEHHHMHGDKVADADWFDEGCCNNHDCKRISNTEVWFEDDKWFWKSAETGQLYVFHKDSRLAYDIGGPDEDRGYKVRPSKDQFHYGCERPIRDEKGNVTRWISDCIYVPGMF